MPLNASSGGSSEPALSQRDWRIAFGLFVLTPVFLFLICTRAPAIYDSGYPLSLALRVLAGDVPHRDFYTQYGPAQLYLFAGIFRVFGVSLFAVVIFEMITRGISIAILYLFLRTLSSKRAAFGVALVFTFILGTFGYPVASYEVLLPVFACAWLASESFRYPLTHQYSVFYGCLCAVATLFRYEQGFMLLMLYGLLLFLAKQRAEAWRSIRIGDVFARLALACGSFIALAGSWITYLMLHDALGDLLYQCFTFPRRYYVAARQLPLPQLSLHHPSSEVIYLVFATLGVAAVYLICLWFKPETPTNRNLGALTFLTMLGLSYAFKASVRIDLGQIAPATIVAVCLPAVVISQRSFSFRALRYSVIALGMACAVFASLSFAGYLKGLAKNRYLAVQYLLHRKDAEEKLWCNTSSPLTRGFCFVIDQNHHDAIRYLVQKMHPGDSFYVGVPRHDHVFASDNLLYFAVNAVPGVKWSNFDPDLQTSPLIQREMISTLRTTRPRFIAETSHFDNVAEPNDSSKYTHVFLLDTFLTSQYHVVQRFGELLIFERNS